MSLAITAVSMNICRYSLLGELENAYDCALCNFLTTESSLFQEHIQLEHRSNFLPCIKCGKLYSTSWTLIKHIDADHRLFTYCCGEEGCNFKTTICKTFLFHIVKCTPSDFPCFGCKMKFSTPESLITHMEHFKRNFQIKLKNSAVRPIEFSPFTSKSLVIKNTYSSSPVQSSLLTPTMQTCAVSSNDFTDGKSTTQLISSIAPSVEAQTSNLSIGATYSLSFNPKNNTEKSHTPLSYSVVDIKSSTFRTLRPKFSTNPNMKTYSKNVKPSTAIPSSNKVTFMQKNLIRSKNNPAFIVPKNTNLKAFSLNHGLMKGKGLIIKQTSNTSKLQTNKNSLYRPLAPLIKPANTNSSNTAVQKEITAVSNSTVSDKQLITIPTTSILVKNCSTLPANVKSDSVSTVEEMKSGSVTTTEVKSGLVPIVQVKSFTIPTIEVKSGLVPTVQMKNFTMPTVEVKSAPTASLQLNSGPSSIVKLQSYKVVKMKSGSLQTVQMNSVQTEQKNNSTVLVQNMPITKESNVRLNLTNLLPKQLFICHNNIAASPSRQVQVGHLNANVLCTSSVMLPRIEQVGSEEDILASLTTDTCVEPKTQVSQSGSDETSDVSLPVKISNVFSNAGPLQNDLRPNASIKVENGVLSEEEPETILPNSASSTLSDLFPQRDKIIKPSSLLIQSTLNNDKKDNSNEATTLLLESNTTTSSFTIEKLHTPLNSASTGSSNHNHDFSSSCVVPKNEFKFVISNLSTQPTLKKVDGDSCSSYALSSNVSSKCSATENTSAVSVFTNAKGNVFSEEEINSVHMSPLEDFQNDDVSSVASDESTCKLNERTFHQSINTYSSKCRKDFLHKNPVINNEQTVSSALNNPTEINVSKYVKKLILSTVDYKKKNTDLNIESHSNTDKSEATLNCSETDVAIKNLQSSDSDDSIDFNLPLLVDDASPNDSFDIQCENHSFAYFTLNETPYYDEVIVEMVDDSVEVESQSHKLSDKVQNPPSNTVKEDLSCVWEEEDENSNSSISNPPLVIDEGDNESLCNNKSQNVSQLFETDESCKSLECDENADEKLSDLESFLNYSAISVRKILKSVKFKDKMKFLKKRNKYLLNRGLHKKNKLTFDENKMPTNSKVISQNIEMLCLDDSSSLEQVATINATNLNIKKESDMEIKANKFLECNLDTFPEGSKEVSSNFSENAKTSAVNSQPDASLIFVNNARKQNSLPTLKNKSLSVSLKKLQSENESFPKTLQLTSPCAQPKISNVPPPSTSYQFFIVVRPTADGCNDDKNSTEPRKFLYSYISNNSNVDIIQQEVFPNSDKNNYCSSAVKTTSQYLSFLKQRKGDVFLTQMAMVTDYFKCMHGDCIYSTNCPFTFKKHFTEHGASVIECTYCLASFPSVDDMVSHSVLQHRRRLYQCSLCFYRACTKTHVQFHLQIYHANSSGCVMKGTPIVIKLAEMLEEPVSIHVSMASIACIVPTCSFSSNSITDAAFHIWKQHKFLSQLYCSRCDVEFSVILDWILHLKSHNVYLLHCLFCSYGCNKRMQMLNHLTSRHADFPLMTYARTTENLLFVLECYLTADRSVPFKAIQHCNSPSTCYCYLLTCPEFEGNSSRIKNLMENVKLKKMHFKVLECLYCTARSNTIKKMEKHLQAEHCEEMQLKYYHCMSQPLGGSELKELFDFKCQSQGQSYSGWRGDSFADHAAIGHCLEKTKLVALRDYLSCGQCFVQSVHNYPHLVISIGSIATSQLSSTSQRVIHSFLQYLRSESSKAISFRCTYCPKRFRRLKSLRTHWKNVHVVSGKKFSYNISKVTHNSHDLELCESESKSFEDQLLIDLDFKENKLNNLPSCEFSNLYDRLKRRRHDYNEKKCNSKNEMDVWLNKSIANEVLNRKRHKNSKWDNCTLCKKAKLELSKNTLAISKDLKSQSSKLSSTYVYRHNLHATKLTVYFREFPQPVKLPISYLEGLMNLHPVVMMRDTESR